MNSHDKYGFRIIRTGCDLLTAKNADEKYISAECHCCGRQIVIPIENYGKSCQERKEILSDNFIN